MDKASAYEAEDCRFDPCRGHMLTQPPQLNDVAFDATSLSQLLLNDGVNPQMAKALYLCIAANLFQVLLNALRNNTQTLLKRTQQTLHQSWMHSCAAWARFRELTLQALTEKRRFSKRRAQALQLVGPQDGLPPKHATAGAQSQACVWARLKSKRDRSTRKLRSPGTCHMNPSSW